MSASASAWQRVIARFRDNRLVPGYTNDFHPSKPYLNPLSENSRVFVTASGIRHVRFL